MLKATNGVEAPLDFWKSIQGEPLYQESIPYSGVSILDRRMGHGRRETLMPIGQKTFTMPNQKIGRNASTGLFTTVKQAQQRPATHVVETIKRAPPPPPSKPKK